MFFFLPGLSSEMTKLSIASTLSILYLGLFPTVIPYLALAYVTSRVGASEATSSLYVTPALAFVLAWMWLGEKPPLLSVIGGVITLSGVMFIHLNVDKFSQMCATFVTYRMWLLATFFNKNMICHSLKQD